MALSSSSQTSLYECTALSTHWDAKGCCICFLSCRSRRPADYSVAALFLHPFYGNCRALVPTSSCLPLRCCNVYHAVGVPRASPSAGFTVRRNVFAQCWQVQEGTGCPVSNAHSEGGGCTWITHAVRSAAHWLELNASAIACRGTGMQWTAAAGSCQC